MQVAILQEENEVGTEISQTPQRQNKVEVKLKLHGDVPLRFKQAN